MTHALFLLAALLAGDQSYQLLPSGNLIRPTSMTAAFISDCRICKVEDGSDEYEPCAWQEERKAAEEAAKTKAKEKSECQAKGCLVVRQRLYSTIAIYPSVDPPDWRCDCEHKPQPPKKAKGKP